MDASHRLAAIGIKADGTVIFYIADGERPVGATQNQVTQRLI